MCKIIQVCLRICTDKGFKHNQTCSRKIKEVASIICVLLFPLPSSGYTNDHGYYSCQDTHFQLFSQHCALFWSTTYCVCIYIYSRLLAITQQTHFLLSAGSASVSFSDVVTSDQCSQPEFTVFCAGVCLKARLQHWRRETEILEYTRLNLPLSFQQLFCCSWGIMEHGCDWITVPSDLESTDQSQQWNVHDSIQIYIDSK